MAWRYKIKPIKEVKEIIKANPDCFIEANYGGGVGYHLMNGKTILCRISKASFSLLNDGLTEHQPPYINVATYKIQLKINARKPRQNI